MGSSHGVGKPDPRGGQLYDLRFALCASSCAQSQCGYCQVAFQEVVKVTSKDTHACVRASDEALERWVLNTPLGLRLTSTNLQLNMQVTHVHHKLAKFPQLQGSHTS